MYSPPGYDGDAGTVKRLCKSLYSLKQAGQKWYDTLSCALANLGFSVSQTDPGVFLARVDEHLLILAVHVDDCIFTGSSSSLVVQYKEKINTGYALTDLGPVHWLLGIKITCDRTAHTVSLLQVSYINSILTHFALADIKPYGSLMVPGLIYSKDHSPTTPEETVCMQKTPTVRLLEASCMQPSLLARTSHLQFPHFCNF
jgi:hypothetical protein